MYQAMQTKIDLSSDLAELLQNQDLFDKSTQQMLSLKAQFEDDHRALLSEQNQNEQRLQRLEGAVVGIETERKAYIRKHASDLVELQQVYEAEKARLESKANQKAESFEESQRFNYEEIRQIQNAMTQNKAARMDEVRKLEELQLRIEETKQEFERYTQQMHILNRSFKTSISKSFSPQRPERSERFEQYSEDDQSQASSVSPNRADDYSRSWVRESANKARSPYRS